MPQTLSLPLPVRLHNAGPCSIQVTAGGDVTVTQMGICDWLFPRHDKSRLAQAKSSRADPIPDPVESELLACFRASSEEARAALLNQAKFAARYRRQASSNGGNSA